MLLLHDGHDCSPVALESPDEAYFRRMRMRQIISEKIGSKQASPEQWALTIRKEAVR